MIKDKGDYIEFYSPDKSDTKKEGTHQQQCVNHLRNSYPEWFFWHTKNEGIKTAGTAAKDEREGVVSGVSDFCIIPTPGGKYSFIAIEIKRVNKSGPGKASAVSKAQKDFLRRVRANGGFAAVAYGTEMFREAIKYSQQH